MPDPFKEPGAVLDRLYTLLLERVGGSEDKAIVAAGLGVALVATLLKILSKDSKMAWLASSLLLGLCFAGFYYYIPANKDPSATVVLQGAFVAAAVASILPMFETKSREISVSLMPPIFLSAALLRDPSWAPFRKTKPDE